MHRVLLVHELIEEIVEELRPNLDGCRRWDDHDRSALCALARTCKSLSGVSLDALWREMTSLEPLMCCIPEDHLSSDADWSRFRLYAARIQVLLVGSGSRAGHLLGDNGLVGLPGFVVVGILQKYLAPSSNGLLPNLRKLDWDAKDLKKSPYLTLLFNSGLLACHATGCDEIEDLLGSLLEVSPKLRVLELKSTVSTISIPIFQYLRTLHVMENNIPYVGLMPSLEDLRWAPRGDQLAAQLGKGIRVCFPALRKVWFHVDVTNLAHVVAFLHSIQTTSLRSFTLIATSETQSDETSLVKRLLEALPRHSKLQEFAFSLRMRASLVLPNSSHLNSLARLSELQSLFFSGIDFHVTDDCIYRLSGAWPKLRKFHIAHLNTSPQPLVTLAALQSFAIHNPHLTYLRIRLDAHPLNPFDSKAQRLDHIRIHFDYSPLSRDCTRQVAESICDIYPCAELIISAGWARTNNSPFDYTVWGEVHNLIPIISSVRYRAPVAERWQRIMMQKATQFHIVIERLRRDRYRQSPSWCICSPS